MQRRDFLKTSGAATASWAACRTYPQETHGGVRNAYIGWRNLMPILNGEQRIVMPVSGGVISGMWVCPARNAIGLRIQSPEWTHVAEGDIPPEIDLEIVSTT